MGTSKRQRQKAGRQSRQQQQAAASKKAKTRRAVAGYGLFALVILGLIVAFGVFRGGGDDDDSSGASPTTTDPDPPVTEPTRPLFGATPCPPAGGTEEPVRDFDEPFERCIDPEADYTAVITTNLGELQVELDPERAPATVNNFVALARSRFYDGLSCHRVIPDFVAQCGDPKGDGTGGPGYRFGDELPEPGEYQIGSLAMANSGADTNGSQFFVILGERGTGLPPQYSLFGQVVAGEDVLEALDAIGNPEDNGVPPLEPVTLESVRITEQRPDQPQ